MVVYRDISLDMKEYNKSLNTKRFYNNDNEHPFRTSFQRDRDRILYSKEFRRQSGKTQIFVAGFGDHMRTRLTHTLEVAQIANTISRYFGFNEDLTEAIAYGHDVGHTPFGHAGERALHRIMSGCYDCYEYNKNLSADQKGFKHNLQSHRVVTQLEKISNEFPGLNLTKSTLWGILNHSGLECKKCEYKNVDGKCSYKNSRHICNKEDSVGFYKDFALDDKECWSFEACIVAVADEIAQRHHDIEDAICASIIDINGLYERINDNFDKVLKAEHRECLEKFKTADSMGIQFYNISRVIVDIYVTQYIESLQSIIEKIHSKRISFNRDSIFEFLTNEKTVQEEQKESKDEITIKKALWFSKDFKVIDDEFQEYLTGIIDSELVQNMDGKATFIIRRLFKAYMNNPQQLPSSTLITVLKNIDDKYKNTDYNFYDLSKEARRLLNDSMKSGDKEYIHILLRTICDHVAGMTDQYALKQYSKLYES